MTDDFDDLDDDLDDDRDLEEDASGPAMTGGSRPDGGTVDATWSADAPADDPPDADVVTLEEPSVRTATFGLPQALWWMYRTRKKREKLASRGYVQWYLFDGAFPNPKFVKPKFEGEGIREYKHDGKRYLFPRDAMLATQEQGMWTMIHRKGEADPVNLRDATQSSIPADALEDYLNMRATAQPPSFWDKFDMDASDAIKWLFVAFVAVALLQQFL
jgi:hypothetical protein